MEEPVRGYVLSSASCLLTLCPLCPGRGVSAGVAPPGSSPAQKTDTRVLCSTAARLGLRHCPETPFVLQLTGPCTDLLLFPHPTQGPSQTADPQ